MFSTSEKKIIKKIRTFIKNSTKVYNFWFVYNRDGNAIDFEGGYELPNRFRNDFSLAPGKYQRVTRTA